MNRLVEILLYTLRPESSAEFHAIMRDLSVPLHHKHGIDVVWFGPSVHDPDGYGLFRAFSDMASLEATQASFYDSEDWRLGPRTEIVVRIESASKLVVPMTNAAIDALRQSGPLATMSS